MTDINDDQPAQSPPGENIPVTDSIHPKQESKNMEVHHHAHAHEKKNWKAYIWEFLMLFLAVFCGFLAEYFLEHRIEKEKGTQFLESFYEDLKTDTGRIAFYTDFDSKKINALEDLSDCYSTILKNTKDDACLMEVLEHTAINKPFIRTERTLKQLVYAGGFRLLKKEDADSILSYDKTCNNFQDFQTTVFQEAQDNVRNTLNMIANFKANVQTFKPAEGKIINNENFNRKDITEPLLFSNDKNLINRYFNEVQLYYRVTYNHRRFLLDLKQQEIWMIKYFNDKYHFE